MNARATLLATTALVLAACGGAAYPTGRPQGTAPANYPPPPRQPWGTPPAATSAPYPTATYAGNNFEDAGVNPWIDPLRDRQSTFALDVDTASYDVGKRFLQDGQLPDRDSVRLEEYVNSFDYGYTPPLNDTFAIDVEGAPSPFVGSRSVLLRIGIQARKVPEQARPPISFTFVIDTSGSMALENRIDLVKDSLTYLVSQLRPDDTVAIVAFGTDAYAVLPPTQAIEPETIIDSLARLQPSGSTNAEAGLALGYDLARSAHRPGAHDRVVLASDGVANVGATDAASILQRVDTGISAGIELVSIGVGMGNFNDALLEQLADHGNGFYAYVNDRSQAEELFGGRLLDALYTVAKEARAQVTFEPDAVQRYRLLGYENRYMPDQDFNNPYADAGEIGAGHSVTALYEIEPAWSRGPNVATVELHWINPDTGARQRTSANIALADFGTDFYSASAPFQLASTVAGFAEILRQSPYVSGYTLADIDRQAQELARAYAGHADVVEFSRVTSMAARLSPNVTNSW